MGWPHTHTWWLRIGRNIFAVKVTIEGGGVLVASPSARERSPIIAGCENQQGLSRGERGVAEV